MRSDSSFEPKILQKVFSLYPSLSFPHIRIDVDGLDILELDAELLYGRFEAALQQALLILSSGFCELARRIILRVELDDAVGIGHLVLALSTLIRDAQDFARFFGSGCCPESRDDCRIGSRAHNDSVILVGEMIAAAELLVLSVRVDDGDRLFDFLV